MHWSVRARGPARGRGRRPVRPRRQSASVLDRVGGPTHSRMHPISRRSETRRRSHAGGSAAPHASTYDPSLSVTEQTRSLLTQVGSFIDGLRSLNTRPCSRLTIRVPNSTDGTEFKRVLYRFYDLLIITIESLSGLYLLQTATPSTDYI